MTWPRGVHQVVPIPRSGWKLTVFKRSQERRYKPIGPTHEYVQQNLNSRRAELNHFGPREEASSGDAAR
jgi:uncharacterized protein YcnI